MTRIKRCPRCGRSGSLQSRWVLNSQKNRYEPYYYVAHYYSKEERFQSFGTQKKRGKIGWCYVPKEVVQSLSNSLSNGLSNIEKEVKRNDEDSKVS